MYLEPIKPYTYILFITHRNTYLQKQTNLNCNRLYSEHFCTALELETPAFSSELSILREENLILNIFLKF